jgi:hypothetical protein
MYGDESKYRKLFLKVAAAPATPAAGHIVTYGKTGPFFCYKDDAGTEYVVATAADIAALIGAAPTGLNTLVELATAIGNDAAFATTVTNALALKQNRSPSIQAVASAATVTPTFSDDMVKVTAQAVALAFANPTGTAIPGFAMAIRIKDNGTSRAITYGTQYRAIGVTLPVATVPGKLLYIGMVYNSDDTKWDVVSVSQES